MTRMVKRPERAIGAPSEVARRLEEVEEDALGSGPGLPGVGVADRSRGVRAPRLAPSLNSANTVTMQEHRGEMSIKEEIRRCTKDHTATDQRTAANAELYAPF